MRRSIFLYQLSFVLILMVCQLADLGHAAAPQRVLHVSPNGDDSADGSADRPLKTVPAAQQRMRERLSAGGAKSGRVEIAAGNYTLDKPLEFTPSDSGESVEHPIVYAAVGGEVVISGGTPISGWRQDGKCWVAKTPDELEPFRDLWVNGRRVVRARAPNDGYFRVEKAGPDDRTSFIVNPADLLKLARLGTAEVGFLHDWSLSRIRLAEIDAASRTYRFDDPIGASQRQFAISHFERQPRYFVENAPELLDGPGEWLLDAASREVRYIPREGEQLESTVAIAPRLERLLVLRGEGTQLVKNVCFDGITFSHSRFDLPPFGYAGIQSSWHERRARRNDHSSVFMEAAVLVDGAQGCRFVNCRFEHLAACGFHVRRSSEVRIDRATFRDIGGDGLLIGTNDQSTITERIQVENCTFEHCGVTFLGAVGLWIGYASDAVVRHNEIRSLPYTGVSVGWLWGPSPIVSRAHQIRNNHIHHVMQILSDGGGIYTLGRQPGTVLAGNVIHDVPLNAGRAESNGIFMDEGSTDILVEHNTIYNIARSPIRFHRAGANKIVANRLVAPPGTPTFQYNVTDPAVMSMIDNVEIVATEWQPPPDDPIVEQAGPKTLP